MKNYVILLAGGVGKRMGADIPKQFLMVKGKPIIVHTIERFQENSQIDKIVVVCVKEWKDYSGIRQNGFQEMDLISMTRNISKYSVTANTSAGFPEIVSRAFNMANLGRKGGVIIDFPLDIQQADIIDR